MWANIVREQAGCCGLQIRPAEGSTRFTSGFIITTRSMLHFSTIHFLYAPPPSPDLIQNVGNGRNPVKKFLTSPQTLCIRKSDTYWKILIRFHWKEVIISCLAVGFENVETLCILLRSRAGILQTGSNRLVSWPLAILLICPMTGWKQCK